MNPDAIIQRVVDVFELERIGPCLEYNDARTEACAEALKACRLQTSLGHQDWVSESERGQGRVTPAWDERLLSRC